MLDTVRRGHKSHRQVVARVREHHDQKASLRAVVDPGEYDRRRDKPNECKDDVGPSRAAESARSHSRPQVPEAPDSTDRHGCPQGTISGLQARLTEAAPSHLLA